MAEILQECNKQEEETIFHKGTYTQDLGEDGILHKDFRKRARRNGRKTGLGRVEGGLKMTGRRTNIKSPEDQDREGR